MSDPSQIIGAIVLAIMAIVFDALQADDPLAMFSAVTKFVDRCNQWLVDTFWSGPQF